jgi:hypothetical protein
MLAFNTAPLNGGIVNGVGALAFTTAPLNVGILKAGSVAVGSTSLCRGMTTLSAANAGAPASTALSTPTATRIVAMFTE